MGKPRGITIQLLEQQKIGTDGFGKAIYEDVPVDVNNVLIGEPNSDEIEDTLETVGKVLAYTLAIPKDDMHEWTGKKVQFFGETFAVIGKPTQGIESLIPLGWNKKVKVEYSD